MKPRTRPPRLRGHAGLAPLVATALVLAALALPGGAPPVPPASARAAAATVYVPAAAHAAGANGASWRTDLEVHNPSGQAVGFTLALLRRDSDNPSPDTRTFSVAARTSTRFTDVLASVFGFDGAAALRVVPDSAALTVTSRTYNLIGPNPWSLPEGSSFGQFVPGIAEEKAIAAGEEGRLIQLTQRDAASLADFRTNVGVLNVTASTIEVRIDLYRADGVLLGTRQGDETRLRAYEFRQLTEVFKPYGTIADGYAVVRTTTGGGRFLAFATVIDNHYSGDPIFIPAARVVVSPSPTPTPTSAPPTPTPTRTPTPTVPPPTPTPTVTPQPRPNLYLYKPPDWAGCVVCDWTTDCCPPRTQFLSEWYDTFAHLVVANDGQVSVTSPIVLGVSLDGGAPAKATWSNAAGLAPGTGAYVPIRISAGSIPAGRHTLTVTVDVDNAIAERSEGDNSCPFTGEWSSIVFRRDGAPPASPAEPPALEAVVESSAPVALDDNVRAPLAAAVELWVPAAAHAAGANGASWRTDLEVHNPGSTAATYTIALMKRDQENAIPETRTFSLDPQRSVRYVDALSSLFGFTGAAALRITTASGSVLATSRTYNLIGPNPWSLPEGSSFGQFVPGLPETEAISSSEEGRLIQLSQRDAASGLDFRTNVGFVNTTGANVDVRLDLYRSDGTYLGTKQGDETRLPPYGFRQLTEAFGAWGTLPGAYAVIRPTTPGGRIFAFATVIDNHASGDPIFVPAARMAASPLPTPTPTPTATPTPPPAPVAVAVSPAAVTLAPGARQTFRATVTGTASTAVAWSVAEGTAGGTIDALGSYTAPSTAGVYHVVATSQADGTKRAQATVVVSATPVDPAYAPQPAVPPSSTTETKEGTVAAGSRGSVGLADGTRVDVPAMPGPVAVTVTRAPENVDTVRTAGQEPTGTARAVTYTGDETALDFVPTVTIPAAEAGAITALNVARIGPVAVDGALKENAVVFLPATRDGSGNVVVRDVLLRGAARLAPAASARPSPFGIVKKVRTIYNLSTYQARLNWAIDPQLVRMVPDKADPARRRPLSSLTAKEREELLRKPVQNVVVLVHGHNEAERFGYEEKETPSVWGYEYKRDVWTLLYEQFQASYAAYADCTAFYEYVYPTYRPVFDGAGALGATLARLLGEDEKLKKQTAKYNLLFVAHSMGGIVARSAINQLPSAVAPSFEKLVTWGSPHHGSPVVTFRYLLTAGYNLYVPGMCATGSTLPLEAFNQVGVYSGVVQSEGAVDTPGERELRWDNSKPLDLEGIGWRRATWQEGDDTRWDPARNPDLYNARLLSFNQSDKFYLSDKYVALYGLTSQLAPIDVTSCSSLVGFVRSKPIPQGAGINRWTYNNGATLDAYPGKPSVRQSDGAVPVDSMVGLGVFSAFSTFSLGDTDHEQYYGAPQGGALTARDKGESTALWTLGKLQLKDAPNKRCDCPALAITGIEKAAPNATVSGKLTWPGDARAGQRVQSVALVRLEGSSRVVVAASSPSVKDDGTVSGTFPQTAFEGLAQAPLFAVTLKDGGELSVAALQMAAVTYTSPGKAGTIYDPPEPGYTVDSGVEAEVLKKLSAEPTRTTWLVGSSGVNVEFNTWWNLRRLDPGTLFPREVCLDTWCKKYEWMGFVVGVSIVGHPAFGTRYEVKNLNEVVRIDGVTIGQGLTDPFGIGLTLWYKVKTTEWFTYDPAGTTRTREDELSLPAAANLFVSKE